jgi:hypothetical protein
VAVGNSPINGGFANGYACYTTAPPDLPRG